MKIRTITLGINLPDLFTARPFQAAGAFIAAARDAFIQAGIEVQTTRLALQPFGDLAGQRSLAEIVALAESIQRACAENEIDYVSLGTIHPETSRRLIPMIPDILAAADRCFLSVTVAQRETGI